MYSSGSSVEAMRAVARRITDERGMRRLRLCVARFRGARRGGAVRALAFVPRNPSRIPVCGPFHPKEDSRCTCEEYRGRGTSRAEGSSLGVAAFPPRVSARTATGIFVGFDTSARPPRLAGAWYRSHMRMYARPSVLLFRPRLLRHARVRARPLTDALIFSADTTAALDLSC